MQNKSTDTIIVKKEISIKKSPINWLLLFVTIIFIINVIFTIYNFVDMIETKYKIQEISNSVILTEKPDVYNDGITQDNLLQYYDKIDEKFDVEMDRLLTIVGIFAGTITLFGFLLSFKAPKDIDRRIEEIKELSNSAKDAAENSKYQSDIIEALNIDYDGNITDFKRINNLTQIIKNYPDKADAYIHRGFLYDNYSDDPKFPKDKRHEYLRKAIIDYQIALELGADEASCYNDIGVAYSKLDEEIIAIRFYNKAIKSDPEEAAYYSNRADSYKCLGNYQQALEDLDKAITFDSKLVKAYICRIDTYEKLANTVSDLTKKCHYYELAVDDLKELVNIDPESIDNRNGLMLLLLKLLRINSEIMSKAINEDEIENYKDSLSKYKKKINDLKVELMSLNKDISESNIDVETILDFEIPKIVDSYTIGKEFLSIDYNGEKKKCKTILTYEDEKLEKKYVIYTDNSYTGDKLNVFACTYRNRKRDGKIILELIKNKEEMSNVKKVVEHIKKSNSSINQNKNYYDLNEVAHFISKNIKEAINEYINGDFLSAEKIFLKLFLVYENYTSKINLAYMKRRGETKLVDKKITELLNENSTNGFELMNLALCYIVGFEVEKSFEKAEQLVLRIKEDIDDVIEWWSNEDLVGNSESNLVMLLIMIYNRYNGKIIDQDEFNKRVNKARSDGYDVSEKY